MRDPSVVYRRRWLMLLVLCISLIVIVLDNTILNVAIPTLSRQLHASNSQLQWIIDAYTIVFAGLLLTAGSLGDRFGRYKALAIGLALFGVFSIASSQATSANTLIITRAFMGIGGALIMPATLSIITNVFVDPIERGKAIGIWAGVSALGVGLGPVTGGFLLSHFWWGSVFLVNVPIILIGLVGGWFFVPDSRDPSAPRLDPVGAVLSIVGLSAVLWAIIEVPVKGWASTPIVVAFAIGLLVLGGFFVWERTSNHPMLDMKFFRNPRFTGASAAITLSFFTLFGLLFLLTQYLQSVLGYSPLKAGAILIPQAAVIMVVAPASSGFVRRFGNKRVVTFGMVVVACTLVLMSRLAVGAPIWQVVALTMLLGLGMGNVMAPATDSVMGSLPREKAGVGSAVNDTTRQVGGAAGVAVLGSIMASQYRSHITSLAAHQLPAGVVAHITTGIGQALGFAQTSAGGPFSSTITDVAQRSYVSGFHTAVLVGAVVMFLSAAGVYKWLPSWASEEEAARKLEADAANAANAANAAGAAGAVDTSVVSPAGGDAVLAPVERSHAGDPR